MKMRAFFLDRLALSVGIYESVLKSSILSFPSQVIREASQRGVNVISHDLVFFVISRKRSL
jgi:hypothetical protein